MSAADRRRAVFLDRDGVLIRSDLRDGRQVAVRALDRFELLPGASESVARLKAAGFLTVVVTNQRDVGDGVVTHDLLDEMHARMLAQLPLDGIEVCKCGDGCRRYKPQPGMLIDAAARFGVDLASSFMVGDRWRDIGAGHAAGCRTVLVGHGHGEPMPVAPDHRVPTISEAASLLLNLL